MSSPVLSHHVPTLLGALLIAETLFLALLNLPLSLSWPVGDDVGFLYYLSWLGHEHQLAPYRDLFDTSFPGTFLTYSLLTGLAGYSDTAFHVMDLAILLILLTMTWLLLKPMGKAAALAAVSGFSLYYLTRLHSAHLQRDYLVLLPLVASLLVVQREHWSIGMRAAQAGLLFATIATIKPQLAIGLPCVFGYLLALEQSRHPSFARLFVQSALFTAAGFCAGWLLVLGWLWWRGGLADFAWMVRHYLPLYMALDENLHPASWSMRWPTFLQQVLLQHQRNLLFALAGAGWALYQLRGQKHAGLPAWLAGLCALYVLAIFIGGKNWDYHRIPAMYFIYITTALLFVAPQEQTTGRGLAACAALYTWCLFSFGSLQVFSHTLLHPAELVGRKIDRARAEYASYRDQQTDPLVYWLQEHLQAGDRVEPRINSTEGSYFRLALAAGLVPASRFPLSLAFYQYRDEPAVQQLRQELLGQLQAHPPRFIIDGNRTALIVDRDGQPSPFPEYDAFLASHYHIAWQAGPGSAYDQFTVYEYHPQ